MILHFREICKVTPTGGQVVRDHLLGLARGYRAVCEKGSTEFFGLRDFYRLN